MAQETRPNILLVVLDCGRWSDLPGGSDPVGGVPFLDSLFRASFAFPRAVAPSPWTIPSHASLFTGLYPWEHGAHLKHSLKLEAAPPTLAGELEAAGYATLSASANGFISPEFGLTRGFSAAAWGTWWERFVHDPDHSEPARGTGIGNLRRVRGDAVWERLEDVGRGANRFPVLEAAANRLLGNLRTARGPFSPEVSSWIEPTVARWLAAQPVSRPVFTFVNYLEPHEPYILDPDGGSTGATWSSLAGLRMDWTSFLSGQWSPSAEQLRGLHDLYRRAIQSLDARIRRLVAAFEAAGRWENTVMVLTSDHGQAFGERGYLFHAARVWEPVVRIPLWIRYPDGQGAGQRPSEWASLVDVAPTLLRLAGREFHGTGSSVTLDPLEPHARSGPVLTVSDGCPAAIRGLKNSASPEVVRFWDQLHLAAYAGDWKVLEFPDTNRVEAHDLAKDPTEQHDDWSVAPPEAVALRDRLRFPVASFAEAKHSATDGTLERRLRSWGYD